MAEGGGETTYIVSKAKKIFLDTDILINALDSHNSHRRDIARNAIKNADETASPVISTLVLQEFFNAATMKLNVDKLEAKELIRNFSNIETVQESTDTINLAIDISVLSGLSFWEALIVASARQASCSEIISEQLKSEKGTRNLEGIQISNPFE
jgi:predicted nucleic acid-binding protein